MVVAGGRACCWPAPLVVLARLAPVVLLPLFYQFKPLERPDADRARLVALSSARRRAGARRLRVGAGGEDAARERGAGRDPAGRAGSCCPTRCSRSIQDDEIEVILAHEIAHHVHHDIRNALALEFVLLGAGYAACGRARARGGGRLGLTGPADPAGLPLLLLAAGAVDARCTPLVNALSRPTSGAPTASRCS